MTGPVQSDLDRQLDELLARTSLADVIASEAAVSEALRLASRAEAFSRTTVASALDAFDRARSPDLPGVTRNELLELKRHLNAYALRATLAQMTGRALAAPARSIAEPPDDDDIFEDDSIVEDDNIFEDGDIPEDDSRPRVRTPDEILSQTTLREIVFWSAGGEALRRRLGKSFGSALMDTMASEFIADDEAEEHLRDVLDTRGYLELAQLVNAFTLMLHRDWASSR